MVDAMQGMSDDEANAALNPQPPVWMVCERCGQPYVLRRTLALFGPAQWAWQRDCEKPRSTCKNAGTVFHDENGPVNAG